jgi:hypothetical protein
MSKTRLDDGLSSLVVGIEELRQIRAAASVPYFAQSPFQHNNTSRLERIRLERKRLYGSGWLKLQSRSAKKEEQLRHSSHVHDAENNEQLLVLDTENASDAKENAYESFPVDNSSAHPNLSTIFITNASTADKIKETSSDRSWLSPTRAESQKLQATVKLLSESLEEIGSLRAVLECSMNPELLDRLLNSSIFSTHGTLAAGRNGVAGEDATTTTRPAAGEAGRALHSSRTLAETAQQELRHRALLLEHSKLLDQVSTIVCVWSMSAPCFVAVSLVLCLTVKC